MFRVDSYINFQLQTMCMIASEDTYSKVRNWYYISTSVVVGAVSLEMIFLCIAPKNTASIVE